MMRRTFFLAIFCGLLSSQLFAQEEAAPQPTARATAQPAYGEKLHIVGIHNAGKINDTLYRGGQPKQAALAELKNLGLTTIVDLRRDDPRKADGELREAAALGMRFVHIPVSGWAPPSDEQVAQFLELFRNDPKQKVFVHCRFGDDRTGVFVAAYRIAMDHWTPEQAIGEMYFFGFNGFWHPSMKKFVQEFPERLRSAPALAPLVHNSPRYSARGQFFCWGRNLYLLTLLLEPL
jgi:tyrosine-protein phosphatase SIW14